MKMMMIRTILTLALFSFCTLGRTTAQVTVTATAAVLGPTSYSTLKQAFDNINSGTHQGSISIVLSGTCNETATAQLNASGTGGASYTAVSISASAVSLVVNSTNFNSPLVRMSGADNVSINGNLLGSNAITFRQVRSGQPVFYYQNGADAHEIRNCVLEGAANSTVDNNAIIDYREGVVGDGNTNLLVDNCDFRNRTDLAISGGSGTTPTGNTPNVAFRSQGLSAADPNTNISLTNNRFYNIFYWQSGRSIINFNSNSSNILFSGNHVYQTVDFIGSAASTTYITVVNVGASVSNVSIQGNYFGGRAPFCAGGRFLLHNPNGNRCRIIWLRNSGPSTTITQNVYRNIELRFYTKGTTCSAAEDSYRGIWHTGGNATITLNQFGGPSATDSVVVRQMANNTWCPIPFRQIDVTTAATVQNNTFQNLHALFASPSAYGYELTAVLASSPTGLNLQQNTVGTGANSITVGSGSAIGSLTGISLNGSGAHTFTNNVVQGLHHQGNSTSAESYCRGISLGGTGTVVATNNTVSDVQSRLELSFALNNPACEGIHYTNTNAGTTFSQNVVSSIRGTGTTAALGSLAAGLLFDGGAQGRISANRVYDVTNTNSGTNGAAAALAVLDLGARLLFVNNMASLGLNPNGSSNAQPACFVGFWQVTDNPTDSLFVAFNTLNLGGTAGAGSANTFAFLRGHLDGNPATNNSTPVQLYNNIFHNGRSGGGASHFAIGNEETAAGWATSGLCGPDPAPDFNAFYASSPANIGFWLGSNQNFGSWKVASAADVNSVLLAGLPIAFLSPGVADLHLPGVEQRPDGKALPLSFFTGTDFDGEFRRSPDIGADEVEVTLVFTGAVDDNWHNPNNWDRGVVPNCADVVQVPVGQTVRVYTSNPAGLFYQLHIQSGGTVEVMDGALLQGCWLYDAPTHAGQLQNDGSLKLNGGTLSLAGRLVDNAGLVADSSTSQLNLDYPLSINACLADYILSFNDDTPTSDVGGTSNTAFHHLRILNSGQTTILSPKDVSVGNAATNQGDLYIDGSGWLSLNDNLLTLEGNFEAASTGTLTGSPLSELQVNGTGPLNVPLLFTPLVTNSNHLLNLSLNRPAGLVPLGNDDVVVHNVLDLTQGVLRTGPTGSEFEAHVLNSAPASVVNYSASSWVHGYLRRAVAGTQLYEYPVGDAARFELLRMNITGALGVSNVRGYFDPSTPGTGGLPISEGGNTYSDVCSGGFWNLTPDVAAAGSAQYDIQIFPVGITCAGAIQALAKRPNAGAWNWHGSTLVSATHRTGYSTFSDFVMVTDPTLPIELLSFTAQALPNQQARLQWATAREVNALGFELERSADGLAFQNLGFVAAQNAVSGAAYESLDPAALHGTNYYRLKLVDQDGSYAYSNTLQVLFGSAGEAGFLVYPNPAASGQPVTMGLPAGTWQLQLLDALGRTAWQQDVESTGSPIALNAGQLSEGVYSLVAVGRQGRVQARLVVR